MPNILNKMMTEELNALLGDLDNCVVVDFQGLSVEEANEFRSTLRKNDILMRVVKITLAKRILGEMGREGYEELFTGPAAVIWGGLDVVQLSKTVHEYARKNKKLQIKGGFLDSGTISKEDVITLTKIPEMPVLLGSIAAGIAAPVQSVYNCVNSLFTSVAYAIDAVREKVEAGGDS